MMSPIETLLCLLAGLTLVATMYKGFKHGIKIVRGEDEDVSDPNWVGYRNY